MSLPFENIKKILTIQYIAVVYLNVKKNSTGPCVSIPRGLPLDVFINDAKISSTNFTLNIVTEASDHYHIIITWTYKSGKRYGYLVQSHFYFLDRNMCCKCKKRSRSELSNCDFLKKRTCICVQRGREPIINIYNF